MPPKAPSRRKAAKAAKAAKATKTAASSNPPTPDKASGNDAPKKSSVTKVTQPVGEVDKDLRRAAINKNAPGVRIILPHQPEGNAPFIAGYLGFSTTEEMKTFAADDPNMQTCMTELVTILATSDFLVANKSAQGGRLQISRASFYSNLSEMTTAVWELINSDGPLPLDLDSLQNPPLGTKRAYANYICCVMRFMKALGDRHIPPDDPIINGAVYNGYTAENWHRGFLGVKHLSREQGRANDSVSGQKRKLSAAKMAIREPVFLVDEDFQTMREEPKPAEGATAEEKEDPFIAKRDNLERAINDDFQFTEVLTIEKDELASVAAHDDDLVSQVQQLCNPKVNDTFKRDARSSRPTLNTQQAYNFSVSLQGRTSVKFGIAEIDEIRSNEVAAEIMAEQGKIISIGQQLYRSEQEPDADGQSLVRNPAIAKENQLDKDAELLSQQQLDRNSPEVIKRMKERALQLKRDMTANSAPIPSHRAACDWLGVDPRSGLWNQGEGYGSAHHGRDIFLKFWQVLAIYFIHTKCMETVYKWCLVALDCGLGKTLSTLVWLHAENMKKQMHNAAAGPDDQIPYRASIIFAPASAVEIWQKEISNFFPNGPFKVIQYYGTGKTTRSEFAPTVLAGDIYRLNAKLAELDPTSPQTGTTLIMTAYPTWWTRTVDESLRTGLQATDGHGNAISESQNVPLPGKVLIGLCDYLFFSIICDESHTLRNPDTLVSTGVQQTLAERWVFLTATPILNKISELRGYMHLCWQSYMSLKNVGTGFHDAYQRDFDPSHWTVVDPKHPDAGAQTRSLLAPGDSTDPLMIQAHNFHEQGMANGDKWWLLDPDNFRACGRSFLWEEDCVKKMVPPILEEVMFRVTTATWITLDTDSDPQLPMVIDPSPDTVSTTPDAITANQESVPGKSDTPAANQDTPATNPDIPAATPDNIPSNPDAAVPDPDAAAPDPKAAVPDPDAAIPIRKAIPRRVGEDVPTCTLRSIELEFTPLEREAYHKNTQSLFSSLFVGDTESMPKEYPLEAVGNIGTNSDIPEGIKDAGVHRLLVHATFDTRLADLTIRNHQGMSKEEKKKASASRKNNWVNTDFDFGASFYFAATRASPEYSIPSDRLALAQYMSWNSVKVRWTLGMLAEKVIKLKEKVILVFEYPMSQWDMEAQLRNLGYNVVSIWASQTQADRSDGLHSFNYDPNVQILCMNTKVGAQSLNLHIGGHIMIVLEMPVNVGLFMQLMGRVTRVGQKHPQEIYLVWIRDSYDQILYHKLLLKFVQTHSGEGTSTDEAHLDVTSQSITIFRKFFGLKYPMWDAVWGSPDWGKVDEWRKKYDLDQLKDLYLQDDDTGAQDKVTPTKGRNKRGPKTRVLRSSAEKINEKRQEEAFKYQRFTRKPTSDETVAEQPSTENVEGPAPDDAALPAPLPPVTEEPAPGDAESEAPPDTPTKPASGARMTAGTRLKLARLPRSTKPKEVSTTQQGNLSNTRQPGTMGPSFVNNPASRGVSVPDAAKNITYKPGEFASNQAKGKPSTRQLRRHTESPAASLDTESPKDSSPATHSDPDTWLNEAYADLGISDKVAKAVHKRLSKAADKIEKIPFKLPKQAKAPVANAHKDSPAPSSSLSPPPEDQHMSDVDNRSASVDSDAEREYWIKQARYNIKAAKAKKKDAMQDRIMAVKHQTKDEANSRVKEAKATQAVNNAEAVLKEALKTRKDARAAKAKAKKAQDKKNTPTKAKVAQTPKPPIVTRTAKRKRASPLPARKKGKSNAGLSMDVVSPEDDADAEHDGSLPADDTSVHSFDDFNPIPGSESGLD